MAQLEQVHKERIATVTVFLRKLPGHEFTYTKYFGRREPLAIDLDAALRGTCDTQACALGWCPALFPEEWAWRLNVPMLASMKDAEGLYSMASGSFRSLRSVCEFFGLSDDEALFLFYPVFDRLLYGVRGLRPDATPAAVADLIDAVVAAKERGVPA